MKRRDFLRKTSIGAGLVAVPATAAASVAHLKNAAEPVRDDLKQRVESLESRFDGLSRSQKKMMRALIVVSGISVGLDLSLLI